MRFLSVSTAVVTLLAAIASWSAPPDNTAPVPDKAYVTDGSVVHDAGRLLLNVTNFGLLGSHYSIHTSYSHAPSGRWPGSNGLNHLWGAGLWIGALTDGVPHVSTGQYETELRATEAPADTIYRTCWNAPLASRYPLLLPDDDNDGLEDEDPFNGRDDDGDGTVDEDAAGVGTQHFRCELDDLHAGDVFPEHVPLGLAVVQQSYQWSADAVADIVGFDFTIRNVGGQFIEDIYVGMFSDFDIDDPHGDLEANDDLTGSFAGLVADESGQTVPVSVGYMYEGDGATVSGYLGWVVLDHPVDPQGEDAPSTVGMRSCQRFEGPLSYSQGGDPANDFERYDALNRPISDGDASENSDYRILVSTGPYANLAPGQELTVSFALVAGADLEAMLENAADAVTLFRGLAFDRDGDPQNGQEFVVRWLGPEEIEVSNEDLPDDDDVPAPPAGVALAAAPNPFNPSLEVRAALPQAESARVTVVDLRGREVRVLHEGMVPAGESRWVWDGRDTDGNAAASGVYLVNLETPTRVMHRQVTLVR